MMVTETSGGAGHAPNKQFLRRAGSAGVVMANSGNVAHQPAPMPQQTSTPLTVPSTPQLAFIDEEQMQTMIANALNAAAAQQQAPQQDMAAQVCACACVRVCVCVGVGVGGWVGVFAYVSVRARARVCCRYVG